MRNHGGIVALHRATCRNEECPFCEGLAEQRAEDDEPDFDPSGAADTYERQFG